MTGKVFNGSPAAFLVLILPLAAGVILLYEAWLWLLGLIGLTILWKVWDKYQWQQLCFQINPTFNDLLQENQGCLTPMDLSLKTNLTAKSAKRFLQRKADEYGAYCKDLPEQGPVYYFITASTLGSIFDDSEPLEMAVEEEEDIESPELNLEEEEIEPSEPSVKEEEDIEPSPSSPPQSILKILETPPEQPSQTTVTAFAQLAELKEERQQLGETQTEPLFSVESEPLAPPASSSASETLPSSEEIPKTQGKLSLIQVDLAKRLDTTPSTIGRRKTDPNFSEWTQSKDPEGIAWKYLRKSRVFVPVDTD
ncbi:conserved hypothetical protein [Rippkaea orientalis PCC 8801]|uniref:Uncharacterized protein n=1 Tax=Rippkaea orientalis (strain PCC 8801 / RF-1) TaxID=41431 RepID=B7JYK6_RIPO1|nr:hypothetical protein [Rippkaea orientalis]ACK64876.1 conserved hypothetical protein [Rippkaea orientalis PCC 8801]